MAMTEDQQQIVKQSVSQSVSQLGLFYAWSRLEETSKSSRWSRDSIGLDTECILGVIRQNRINTISTLSKPVQIKVVLQLAHGGLLFPEVPRCSEDGCIKVQSIVLPDTCA